MHKAAIWLGALLQTRLKENVLGPEAPPVGRIRNLFITNILVKIPKQQSVPKTKKFVSRAVQSFHSVKDFSTVKLTIDVDNY